MTLKLWQVVATVAAATFFVGLLAGRYAFPHESSRTQAIDALLRQSSGPDYQQRARESEVQANVRALVPALEAYNADHGGYSGATVAGLQASYDAGIQGVEIAWANRSDYCAQSTVGSVTYHKHGPAGEILSGPC